MRFRPPSGRKATKIQLKNFKNSNLYGEGWSELSKQVRQRDSWTCQRCKKNCSNQKQKLHAHHIIELSKGGKNRSENLISVCEDCHKIIHRR
jgi:5-methylcytosine-specific restriction endonuclease McrA